MPQRRFHEARRPLPLRLAGGVAGHRAVDRVLHVNQAQAVLEDESVRLDAHRVWIELQARIWSRHADVDKQLAMSVVGVAFA